MKESTTPIQSVQKMEVSVDAPMKVELSPISSISSHEVDDADEQTKSNKITLIEVRIIYWLRRGKEG